MTDSILDSVKAALGLAPTYDAFDQELIMHINSEFGTLQQLGAGPITGFAIADSTSVWSDWSPDMLLLSFVRSYMAVAIKIIFDPPQNGATMMALEKMREEWIFRINLAAEAINPPSDPIPVDTSVLEIDLEIEKGALFGDL